MCALALAALASLVSSARPALAQSAATAAAQVPAEPRETPVKVRVRGSSRIEARASRSEGEVLIYGALTDDAGRPLSAETLSAVVRRDSDARDARTADAVRGARSCDARTDGGAEAPARATAYGVRVAGASDAPEVLLVTDEDGRFCFRTKLDPDRYAAELAWKGKALVEPVTLRLSFDASRQALALRFDPTPRVVPLDFPRASFEVVALLDENGRPTVAPGMPITLATEAGTALGTETTDRYGRARFAVDTAMLGPPGRGELRAAFAGNADVAFSAQAAEIERHVKVLVRMPAAERGELERRVPDDGIPLTVDVTSAVGLVSEGAVEARLDDVVVGAAPVERGIARVTLTFAGRGDEAPVRFRYVPVSPWYEPIGETTIRVPIRGPGLLAKAPVLVAGLAVLAVFLLGRLTSSARKTRPEPEPRSADLAPEGKPAIELLRPADRGDKGWSGRVLDAHDGTPVAAARVWIERGTFDGRASLVSVSTDAHGRFVLPEPAGPPGLVGGEQLAAESRLHARHLQTLPGPGELSISLVLRRRALLARLVAWSRRAGAPFDLKPEPTPGHVKRAAGPDFQTARWADEVERAVFGGGELDARAESEIDRLAPGPQPGSADAKPSPDAHPDALPNDRR